MYVGETDKSLVEESLAEQSFDVGGEADGWSKSDVDDLIKAVRAVIAKNDVISYLRRLRLMDFNAVSR